MVSTCDSNMSSKDAPFFSSNKEVLVDVLVGIYAKVLFDIYVNVYVGVRMDVSLDAYRDISTNFVTSNIKTIGCKNNLLSKVLK